MPTSELTGVHADLLETVPLPPTARIRTADVPYEHEGTALEGYLAYDESLQGPRPAVLIVHDWSGVGPNVQMRAQMLARLGYVALATDVYGAGVRPTGDDASALAHSFYRDLPLLRSRVRAGFDYLEAHPGVDPNSIVVIGYCFGGSATIEFARSGASAAGYASFHGGLIVHEPSDAASIGAPLLVMTGAADTVVPDEAIVSFENELRTAPDVDWTLISYGGAPHAFTVPGHNYRPRADARSWRELVGFLAETVG